MVWYANLEVITMKYMMLMVLFLTLPTFATQWQPPEPATGLANITGLNLNSDGTIMYCTKWHDGFWGGDICYYFWNGTQWVWGDWVQGNVNSSYTDEEEPFITYDGQHLYFSRYGLMYGYTFTLCVADWDGSQFVNSRPLNSDINQGNSRFPSLTQDMQHLYYANGLKIYVSDWNGSDWGVPTILPREVNQSGLARMHVTITPDGNEIYFTGGMPQVMWLAFSQKINGVWQQWQYCDYNINPTSSTHIDYPAFTYSDYADQYLYFYKNIPPGYYHSLRSPVSVEPASLGQIKSLYR
jgi:hypothetical protein